MLPDTIDLKCSKSKYVRQTNCSWGGRCLGMVQTNL
uniref:Uncharacterized protein n=1 Tax=Anguilla anguilla TaxID=7936 RepID=A0A0E9THJ4_ANGAN